MLNSFLTEYRSLIQIQKHESAHLVCLFDSMRYAKLQYSPDRLLLHYIW